MWIQGVLTVVLQIQDLAVYWDFLLYLPAFVTFNFLHDDGELLIVPATKDTKNKTHNSTQ